MKKIPLTQGKFALIDDRDYLTLSKFNWCALKHGRTFRAVRKFERRVRYMHHFILVVPKGMEVDHIDGNGLNNQRDNLRACTRAENNRNRRKPIHNTSGLKGVYWRKRDRAWCAMIGFNKRRIWLGSFTNKNQAHCAYLAASLKYHGTFAR